MNNVLLRDFLEIPYDKLEEMNLEAKEDRLQHKDINRVLFGLVCSGRGPCRVSISRA